MGKLIRCRVSVCSKMFEAYPCHNRRYCSKECADSSQGKRQQALRRAITKRKRGLKPYQAIACEYKGIYMDSSWELTLAKRLDSLGIKWTRGEEKMFWYDRFEECFEYQPDFYLPDYDIFLEVKGSHLMFIKEDEADKQEYITRYLKNVVFLRDVKVIRNFNIKRAVSIAMEQGRINNLTR